LAVQVPAARAAGLAAGRPHAAFLAQLIATARQLPQTRERRRDSPRAAETAYRAAAARTNPARPGLFRRI
jgi:hypothetical protein